MAASDRFVRVWALPCIRNLVGPIGSLAPQAEGLGAQAEGVLELLLVVQMGLQPQQGQIRAAAQHHLRARRRMAGD
jgi:hypothetical protein